jgi:hypothetical protein
MAFTDHKARAVERPECGHGTLLLLIWKCIQRSGVAGHSVTLKMSSLGHPSDEQSLILLFR